MKPERDSLKERMSIVIAGHVDHGKSTILGRLLADSQSLPDGKLERIKAYCERNSKPFEYAFLIDALKDEQTQGITIDSARVFLRSKRRDYILHDAPGHIEFLKNMITGASRAEAALLIIDVMEGVRENSRRHGYILSLLGIKQIAVLINKMDLAGYRKERFERVAEDYSRFLSSIGLSPLGFVPVSGFAGDNLVTLSQKTSWYRGQTVLEILGKFADVKPSVDQPFRMPVQDVYKFTELGDSRRIVAGTIETGSIRVGDEVVFYPSGKKSRIKSIENFNGAEKNEASAPYATGFQLTEQIYILRGEMASKASDLRPKVTSRLRVSLFWLGKEPMRMDKDYLLKIGTAKVSARIEEIRGVIDSSTLSAVDVGDKIGRYEVAECILKLRKAIAFDLADEVATTSRFVIVDHYDIRGGGIALEALEDKQTLLRDKLFLRDYKWEKSLIPQEVRAERYGQRPTLILITGEKDSGKKPFAKHLEERLFLDGNLVYFLGIANVLYGVDADIKSQLGRREEHLRRLAEVVHLMLDAGFIVIATAIELTQEDLEEITTVINQDSILVIWMGETVITDIQFDFKIPKAEDVISAVETVKKTLCEKKILIR
jgi:bifunctional enzyme CysN/CysC